MAFQRSFDISLIESLTKENDELYQKLVADVMNGEVFPTVRAGNLDFYHRGGLLFSFDGKKFVRNNNYDNYSEGTEGLESYAKCKKQNANRFSDKERQILEKLNRATFTNNENVAVIDVEVRINEDNNKKCDMVLLNKETAQIMFVEGKLYQNSDLAGDKENPPHIIQQVCGYTQTNVTYKDQIEMQYSKHIEIVNTLFKKDFPTKVSLVLPTKLLVYSEKDENEKREVATNVIKEYICRRNIMWNFSGEEPTLNIIWKTLNR